MSDEFKEPLLPSSPLTPGETKLFFGSDSSRIIIHYWSDFDSGDHQMHEMDISHNSRILDVILEAINQFELEHKNLSDYSLRMANGSGKPKTSMPAFDLGQNALETRITRFALCYKRIEKQETFVQVEETSPVLKSEEKRVEEKRVQTLQQDEKKRRKFCCCFYSD